MSNEREGSFKSPMENVRNHDDPRLTVTIPGESDYKTVLGSSNASLQNDAQHLNALEDSASENQSHLWSNSISMDSLTDVLAPSDSDGDFSNVRKKLECSLRIIQTAEQSVSCVLESLETLWISVDGSASILQISATSNTGEHKLLQMIGIVRNVVHRLEAALYTSRNISAPNKLKTLEQSNRLLQEQLESSRVILSCLESELKYQEKEKALLHDEIRHLMHQLASKPPGQVQQVAGLEPAPAETADSNLSRQLLTEPFQQYSKTECRLTRDNSTAQICQISHKQSGILRYVGKISTTNIQKREHDFDTIMSFVRKRGNTMDSLSCQLDKYNDNFQRLQEEIYDVASEKMELHRAYELLLDKHKALLQERQNYEGILNMIMKERKGTEESIHQILEALITKLNAISGEEGRDSKLAMVESALHAVQGQNSQYRDEMAELKCKLNSVEQNNLIVRTEMENALAKCSAEAEKLKKELEIMTNEIGRNQKTELEQHEKMQHLYEEACSEKENALKRLEEKETELSGQRLTVENLQKKCFKQEKNLQELQKTNNRLMQAVQKKKRNIEQLNATIHQLQTDLKERKFECAEMIKAAGDETAQAKDHCRWLQSQIDHLNHQLEEAHDRIKGYEKEKTSLAQQVMSAEEERKVVDRKLDELRTALQGDTVLREALMERNEALQIEINRLRRAKLMHLSVTKEGDHTEPPSEMSSFEVSTLSYVPPATFELDKYSSKKNRYAAGIASNYPGRDVARNAISAHGSALIAASQNGNSKTVVD